MEAGALRTRLFRARVVIPLVTIEVAGSGILARAHLAYVAYTFAEWKQREPREQAQLRRRLTLVCKMGEVEMVLQLAGLP